MWVWAFFRFLNGLEVFSREDVMTTLFQETRIIIRENKFEARWAYVKLVSFLIVDLATSHSRVFSSYFKLTKLYLWKLLFMWAARTRLSKRCIECGGIGFFGYFILPFIRLYRQPVSFLVSMSFNAWRLEQKIT